MTRRSTVELLRTLRRRERENQGRVVAETARGTVEAEKALAAARAKHAAANDELGRIASAEERRVDAGVATAGMLAQAHAFEHVAKTRIRELDEEATRAAERARVATTEEARERARLEQVRTAEKRVDERAAELVAEARARDEGRDEEAFADAWNAKAGAGRSPGPR